MMVRARLAPRRRPAPSIPARSSAVVGAAVLLWSIAVAPAFGGEGDRAGGTTSAPAPADVALIGSDAAIRGVRPVIEELLSREGFVVAWSRPQRFQSEQLLAGGAGAQRAPIAAWIDLSSNGEARMYFRDPFGQRFALRRLACRPTFDELAAEEIAQVVKSVLLALASGDDREALSLSEARVALEPIAVPSPSPSADRVRASPRGPAVEVRSFVVGQRFAPQLSLSGRIELDVAVLSARTVPPAHGPPGRFGAWLAGGYGLPMEYSDGLVSVALRTVVLRAGALWEPWRGRLLSIRMGLGAGVDWVTFQPRAGAGGVTPAQPGRFVTPTGSLVAGVGFDPGEHLSLAVNAVVDIAEADVHYDLLGPGGAPARVLVPFVVRPGLSLGAGWRF